MYSNGIPDGAMRNASFESDEVRVEEGPGELTWEMDVPIFRTALIMKQLGFGIGIPFLVVVLVIVATSGKSVYTLYALGLIGALFLFTWLFIMVVYRGTYEVEFVLDDKGVFCRTRIGQARKNRLVNTLAVILGLFSGKPSVAGAGLLAQSKQTVFLRWKRIRKVRCIPRQHCMLLRGGPMEEIALFCSEEKYDMIERFVLRKTGRSCKVSRR